MTKVKCSTSRLIQLVSGGPRLCTKSTCPAYRHVGRHTPGITVHIPDGKKK